MHLWNVPLLFAPKCSKNQKKTIFFKYKKKVNKRRKKKHKKMRPKKREERKLQGR
jgi:hypothetical protein